MQHYFVKKENEKFYLEDSDFHHVKNVMRLKNHDKIICINDNQKYLCEIIFTKDSYLLNVLEQLDNTQELKIDVCLYQALIKNDKFDLVIQKATELGVSKIIPTICKRSIIKVEDNKKESKIQRYQKIVKEACEQSQRSFIPTIENFLDLKDITLGEDTLGLIAYENNEDYLSLYNALKDLKKYKKIAFVIGPEGGFEEKEVKQLLDKGFKSVSLGARILRSETASIYALSVASFVIESMGEKDA